MVKRTVELFNLDVIISDGKGSKELEQISVVKDSLTTATDGKNYLVKYYNLIDRTGHMFHFGTHG